MKCFCVLKVAVMSEVVYRPPFIVSLIYRFLAAVFLIFQWLLGAQMGLISVCKVAASDVVDSYYVMKYISTAPAEEITITVGYQLRCCAPDIRWDFSIGMYVLMSSTPLSQFPDPNTSPYMYVGELRNISALQGTERVNFTSQKVVSMRNFRGIYIGFRTRGICGNIHSVAMHYYKCPQIGGEQMVFPATAAPTSSTAVLRIGGKCIAHSETDKTDNNFMLCYTNGTAKFYGRCYCSAGYQSLSVSQCIGKKILFLYLSRYVYKLCYETFQNSFEVLWASISILSV